MGRETPALTYICYVGVDGFKQVQPVDTYVSMTSLIKISFWHYFSVNKAVGFFSKKWHLYYAACFYDFPPYFYKTRKFKFEISIVVVDFIQAKCSLPRVWNGDITIFELLRKEKYQEQWTHI